MADNKISVWVNGAKGKMGRQVTQAVQATPDLVLSGQSDKDDNLTECLSQAQPDVCVDFTHPEVVYKNASTIIAAGVSPIIGTTGLKESEVKALAAETQDQQGGLIAPNFAIGAILMMRFAAEAAKFFSYAEIVEIHHDGKADAPSGTAISTAAGIQKNRPNPPSLKTISQELYQGALGAKVHGTTIHALRLPGFIANQEVILSQAGENLRISHQVIHRECFMPGVILACRKVPSLTKLHYGLESII